MIPEGSFGSDGVPLTISLAFLEDWAEPIRLVFLFASFVGLLWFMGTAFLKLNGDAS